MAYTCYNNKEQVGGYHGCHVIARGSQFVQQIFQEAVSSDWQRLEEISVLQMGRLIKDLYVE